MVMWLKRLKIYRDLHKLVIILKKTDNNTGEIIYGVFSKFIKD